MLSIVREQGEEGSGAVVVGDGGGSVQTYLVIVQSCMVVIQQFLVLCHSRGGEGSGGVVWCGGRRRGSVQTYLVIVQSCMVVIQKFLVLCHNAPMIMLKFKKFFPTKV